MTGESLRVDANTALALHMVLHELATNAIKYGALASDKGRIMISWGRADCCGSFLVWTESGGPVVKPPETRGLGSRLFETAFANEGSSVSSPTSRQAWSVASFHRAQR